MNEKHRRLFIAVDPSAAVTNAAAQVLSELREESSRRKLRARWSRAENLHLSVKFLGATPESLISEVESVLRQVAERMKAFEVGVRGAGVFPNPSFPRVLWLGVQDPEHGLAELARQFEERMEILGFVREERAFHPHLTLARTTEREAAALLKTYENRDFGAFDVSEVILYESLTLPEGAVYRPLTRVSFSGGSSDRLSSSA